MAPTAAGRRSTLPVVVTSMLGRDREIGAVRVLLGDPAVRLVTITGPGGVGKTRLAIALAADADAALDPIFVPLAAVRQAERVIPAIGREIGLNLEPRSEGEKALIDALQGRPALLVLDNLEQIADVAPVVARLLSRLPDLKMIATSQVELGVAGEHAFGLRPLSLPDIGTDNARASDAVRLFLDRAAMVDPHLDVDDDVLAAVTEICRRLDGLPLAIELAAARSNLLSPQALLRRLDDRLAILGTGRADVDARHRTLRAAISWSYDLLDPDAQRLFRRLSVFTGISPEAARTVAGKADPETVDAALEELRRRHLVREVAVGNAPRYEMFESLRAFGIAELARLGEEDAARDAHAAWLAAFAEVAAPSLRGGDQAACLARLALETDNLRAAIDWSLATGHEEYVARIVGAIWRFFGNYAMITDARAWVAAALTGRSTISPWHRADALVAAGYLSLLYHRDRDAGERWMRQALALASAIGHEVAEMRAYGGLGIAAYDRGDYPRATEMYTRGQELARRVGTPGDVAIAANNLGLVSYVEGRVEETLVYWEESVLLNREAGDQMMEAQVQANLGGVKNALGRIDEAREHLQRALDLQRSINNRSHLPNTLINSGENALLRGDLPAARSHYAEARGILRETGNAVYDAAAVLGLAAVSIREGDARAAAAHVLDALGLLGENREPMRMLELTETLAAACGVAGDHAGTIELLAAAARLREEHGNVAPVVGAGDLDRLAHEATLVLGEEAAGFARQRGTALDIDGMKVRASILARKAVGRRIDEPDFTWPRAEEPEDAPDYGLTARELEILRMLGSGQSTPEIARALSVSPRTVSTHIANLMAKLGVASRTAAVAQALRDGIIHPAP